MSILRRKSLWYLAIPLALLALALTFTPVRQASAVPPPPNFALQQTIDTPSFANGLAVDADDNIRVTLTVADELRVFDENGILLSTFVVPPSTFSNGQVLDAQPRGIAIDAFGNSVLSEGSSFVIATRSATGTLISSFEVGTANNIGVEVDADGNYLLSQSGGGNNGGIGRYTSAGVLIDVIGFTDPANASTTRSGSGNLNRGISGIAA